MIEHIDPAGRFFIGPMPPRHARQMWIYMGDGIWLNALLGEDAMRDAYEAVRDVLRLKGREG